VAYHNIRACNISRYSCLSHNHLLGAMANQNIELREVTKENWLKCIELELDSSQSGYVSTNLFSLAQSKFEPCRVPCAIYNSENEMVGFTMYNNGPLDDGTYRISRLMIDKSYQGFGYGRLAALAVIEQMKRIKDCDEILLDYAPDNNAAANLWHSLGFEVSGREGTNILAKLKTNR